MFSLALSLKRRFSRPVTLPIRLRRIHSDSPCDGEQGIGQLAVVRKLAVEASPQRNSYRFRFGDIGIHAAVVYFPVYCHLDVPLLAATGPRNALHARLIVSAQRGVVAVLTSAAFP